MGDQLTRNIDQSMVTDSDVRRINCYADSEANIVRVSGGIEWKDLEGVGSANSATPVDGLYWYEASEALIVLIEGQLIKILKVGANYVATGIGDITNILLTGKRPTFAVGGATSQYLLAANGNQMVVSTSLGAQTRVADADAPTEVTHVGVLDGYFLANQVGTQKFFRSALNDPTSWAALDFAQAVGSSDILMALHVVKRYIYLFGKNSTEIWYNDGSTPFSRIDGGFLRTGTLSPYSIIPTEEDLYWLNDKRRFVHFNGSGVEELECPYLKEIEAFDSVEDCTGDRIETDGQDFLEWNFVSANRTLVLNLRTMKWHEKGQWDANRESFDLALNKCYAYAKNWGFPIIGRKNAPILDVISSRYYTDGDGTRIRHVHLTGNLSHGSLQQKRCNGLKLLARTGDEASPTEFSGDDEPVIMVRYRDNDAIDWSNQFTLGLGYQGQKFNVLKRNQLGTFITRQWEFSSTDAVPVIYGKAEIDVDLLAA